MSGQQRALSARGALRNRLDTLRCLTARNTSMSSLIPARTVSTIRSSSSSSKRATNASFKPATSARTAQWRVNAARDESAAAGCIDRRQMLGFSAVLPLILQQSAQADDGESVQPLIWQISPPKLQDPVTHTCRSEATERYNVRHCGARNDCTRLGQPSVW